MCLNLQEGNKCIENRQSPQMLNVNYIGFARLERDYTNDSD